MDPCAHLGEAETRPELNLEDYRGCHPFAFESRSLL
jgi:hypothetical protein